MGLKLFKTDYVPYINDPLLVRVHLVTCCIMHCFTGVKAMEPLVQMGGSSTADALLKHIRREGSRLGAV